MVLTTVAGLGLTIGCHQADEDFGCGHETVVEVQDYELAVAGRWQIPAQVMEAGSTSRVPITSAGAWQGQSSCSGTFTEGARRVQAYISARWPEVISIGGYSCRHISGDDQVTSIHAVGRALDIMLPLDNGQADNAVGDPIANFFVTHAQEIGVQRVIWDRTYWRSGNAPREGYYGGAHPHHDHIHLELSVDASQLRTPFFENGERVPGAAPCADPLPRAGGLQLTTTAHVFRFMDPRVFGEVLATQAKVGTCTGPTPIRTITRRTGHAGVSKCRRMVNMTYRRIPWLPTLSTLGQSTTHQPRQSGETVRNPQVGGVTGWTGLGRYRFMAGESYFVDVFDNVEGAVAQGQHITADAIRVQAFVPHNHNRPEPEPEPEPETEPETPPSSGDADDEPRRDSPVEEDDDSDGEADEVPTIRAAPRESEPSRSGRSTDMAPSDILEGDGADSSGAGDRLVEPPESGLKVLSSPNASGGCSQAATGRSSGWFMMLCAFAMLRRRRRQRL